MSKEAKKQEANQRISESANQQEANEQEAVLEEKTPVEAAQAETVAVEEFNALKAQLEESQARAAEYLDGWQRSLADFSNYKKRVERENSQVYQNAAGEVIKRCLPVLDDIERAMKNRPTDGGDAAWAEGVELIYRKLQAILEAEGVKRMEAETEMFDPSRHEAILQVESAEHQSGQVIEVIQQGYLLGERVLRPAMVKVAK